MCISNFQKKKPETKNDIQIHDLCDSSTATVNALVTLVTYNQLYHIWLIACLSF